MTVMKGCDGFAGFSHMGLGWSPGWSPGGLVALENRKVKGFDGFTGFSHMGHLAGALAGLIVGLVALENRKVR